MGWWKIDPETGMPLKDGHSALSRIPDAVLLNAVPGVDDAEAACYLGDGAWDMASSVPQELEAAGGAIDLPDDALRELLLRRVAPAGTDGEAAERLLQVVDAFWKDIDIFYEEDWGRPSQSAERRWICEYVVNARSAAAERRKVARIDREEPPAAASRSMEKALRQFLARLEGIDEDHEIAGNLDARTRMGEDVLRGFLRLEPGFVPSGAYGLTPEADRLVARNVARFVEAAREDADRAGIATFHQRLAAFQNPGVRTEDGSDYLAFFDEIDGARFDVAGKEIG